jgi:hypothetical protein
MEGIKKEKIINWIENMSPEEKKERGEEFINKLLLIIKNEPGEYLKKEDFDKL